MKERRKGEEKERKKSGKKGRRWNNAAALPKEGGRGECGRRGGGRGLLEWESVGGSVRVGVRNRLGEAIGKPVANLHGRWTSAARVPREKGKKDTPVLRFSADRSTYRSNLFSFHFSSLRLSGREYREWRGSGRERKIAKCLCVRKMCFGRIMSWILDSRNSISPSFTRIQSKLDRW